MMSQVLRRLRGDGPTTLLTILVSVATLRGLASVVFTTTTTNVSHSAEPVAAPEAGIAIDDDVVTYDQVQPILRKHCLSCHNESQARGGLSLSGLDKIEAGSTSGDVVVPGAPEESLLYLVTAHLENPKMPPNKPKIPARELAIIEKWITTGLAKELGKEGNESKQSESDATEEEVGSGSMQGMQSMLSADAEESVSAKKTANTKETIETSTVSYIDATPLPQANPITAIAAHSTRSAVVVPGLGQILFMNGIGKESLKAIPVAANTITILSYSRNGKYLFVGCGTPGDWGKVLRLDLDSLQWDAPIGDESDTPLCMSESPDGRFLAIGNTSKNINVYEVSTGKLVHTLKKHTDWVTFVSWSPDGLLLTSGDRFGSILVWEAESGKVFTNLRNHVGSVTGLVWSCDGDELFSTGWDGTLRRWDLHTQREVKNWPVHTKGSHGLLSLSRDQTVSAAHPLVSYGRDGRVRIWNLDGGLIAERSLGEEIVATAFSLSSDKRQLMVCDASGSISSLSIDSDNRLSEEMSSLSVPVKKVDSEFTLYRPSAPARLASVAKSESNKVAVSPMVSDSKSDSDLSKNMEVGNSVPATWKSRLASDLADSQRALDSIELSRAQLIESLSQIEESAARLKQLIAIQEARLKQLELSEEPK
ncbi:MAG: c-type cytochrome domain-containing protein [Pirellula sp.]